MAAFVEETRETKEASCRLAFLSQGQSFTNQAALASGARSRGMRFRALRWLALLPQPAAEVGSAPSPAASPDVEAAETRGRPEFSRSTMLGAALLRPTDHSQRSTFLGWGLQLARPTATACAVNPAYRVSWNGRHQRQTPGRRHPESRRSRSPNSLPSTVAHPGCFATQT